PAGAGARRLAGDALRVPACAGTRGDDQQRRAYARLVRHPRLRPGQPRRRNRRDRIHRPGHRADRPRDRTRHSGRAHLPGGFLAGRRDHARRGPAPQRTAGRAGRAVDLPARCGHGRGGPGRGGEGAAAVHGPWHRRPGRALRRGRAERGVDAPARLRGRVPSLPDAALGLHRRDPRPRRLDRQQARRRLSRGFGRWRGCGYHADDTFPGRDAPVKILIADDEPLARERLRMLLAAQADVEVVAEVGDGHQTLHACAEHDPDLVLLDIAMPGIDGLEVARHLQAFEPRPVVVFCTAYDAHALSAFDAEAADYLVKPVRAERLALALQRARMLTAGRQRTDGADTGATGARRTHLCARLRGSLRLIPIEDVRYLQAEEKYVVV